MEFYQGNFAVFALINALLAYREYRQDESIQAQKEDGQKVDAENSREILKAFKLKFIPIYLLVNGADWLQVRLLIQPWTFELTSM